jgi:CSLREA domain-containing protein
VRHRATFFFGVISALAALSLCANAAVFMVTSTVDGADALPGDGVCAALGGLCTLRAATEEANALDGADSIVLPTGKHKITLGELMLSGDTAVSAADAKSCIVRGNRRSRLLRVAIGASVSISGVTLERGVADSGGAIFNDGTLVLTDTVVARNRARRSDGGLGGGIFNNGSLTMTRVRLQDNRASGCNCSFGGGLFNNGTGNLEQVTAYRNRVTGCGGAIFHSVGTLQVANSVFDRNVVNNSGGGLFVQAGSADLTNVLIRRNRATKIGGGVFTYGELSLVNVTLSSNYSHDGGGLFSGITQVADLRNVTITANRAAQGGGILNNGTVSLQNSLVAGNRPHDCGGSALTSNGHNLAADDSCGLAGSADRNATNPRLDRLRDNGGFSLTYALQPGSPAIDGGDDASCPTTDQRSVPRPADGNSDGMAACDIGAYEAP